MIRFRYLIFAVTLFCQPFYAWAGTHTIQFSSIQELQQFFVKSKNALPLISAHRGGPVRDYPENALETFQHTLENFYATLEMDVSRTKDGKLVLFHDDRLGRSSTGRGLLRDKTLAELQALYLKDERGTITSFRIPLFSKVLDWAKAKTILFVDVKLLPGSWKRKSLSEGDKSMFRQIVEMIQARNAQSHIIMITYNQAQTAYVHSLDPSLMISAGVFSKGAWRSSHQTYPSGRVVAFTGVIGRRLKKDLYPALAQSGIWSIAATFRVEKWLARMPMGSWLRSSLLSAFYERCLNKGVGVIATDRYEDVASVFRGHYQKAAKGNSARSVFFKRYFKYIP